VQETSKKVLLMKIDFDKAYDGIEWDFILNMLDWLGFDSFHHRLVETLFSWTSIRVCVNDVCFNLILVQ
jgi:hypothetical protein